MPPRVSVTKKPSRPPGEQHVWDLFLGNASYQAFGCCMNPACDDPLTLVMTAGSSPSRRICVVCFEFQFGCKHPAKQTLDLLRRR